MGGAIAIGIADRHPDLVHRLVLVDPAGMPVKQSPLIAILKVPYLGEWLFDYFAEKLLVAGLAKDLHTREKVTALEARYRVQMQYVGFKRALISTLRHGPIHTMERAYQRVGQNPIPILLIWGREDRTVPFKLIDAIRAALPNAEFHAIDGAGHVPHYEVPDIINPLIIRFLSEASPFP
jgi:pimeloyl-ACP methyl ester carboxylesterase